MSRDNDRQGSERDPGFKEFLLSAPDLAALEIYRSAEPADEVELDDAD